MQATCCCVYAFLSVSVPASVSVSASFNLHSFKGFGFFTLDGFFVIMKKQAARPGKLLRHGTRRQQPEKQTTRGSCFDMAPGDSSLKNKPPGEAASTWHRETDSLENRPPARGRYRRPDKNENKSRESDL